VLRGELPEALRGELPEALRGKLPEALCGELPEALRGELPDVGRPFQGRRRTVIMCAEAVWWQCHRQLIADGLVARGDEVRHIMGAGAAPTHKLTAFARVKDGRVSYPGLI
jgi:hypothetical protein